MTRFFLTLLLFISPLLVAASTTPPAAAASPSLHAGCWGVFDPNDEPTIDNAEEVLCVDKSGHASIRDSSFYGEGVKGCNVVTMRTQSDTLIIDVNYKRCTNDAPSHTMTCSERRV